MILKKDTLIFELRIIVLFKTKFNLFNSNFFLIEIINFDSNIFEDQMNQNFGGKN